MVKIVPVYQAIAVDIDHPEYVVELVVGELLANIVEDSPELGMGYEAIVIPIENGEGIFDDVILVEHLVVFGHQLQEIPIEYTSSRKLVQLLAQSVQFRLGGILANGPHHSAQIVGGNGASAIRITVSKGVADLVAEIGRKSVVRRIHCIRISIICVLSLESVGSSQLECLCCSDCIGILDQKLDLKIK